MSIQAMGKVGDYSLISHIVQQTSQIPSQVIGPDHIWTFSLNQTYCSLMAALRNTMHEQFSDLFSMIF